MPNAMSSFFTQHKNILFATMLFVAISGIYTLSFDTWYFDGEDELLIYQSSLIHTPKDLIMFLFKGDVQRMSTPIPQYLPNSNKVDSVGTIYYRPGLKLAHFIEWKILGNNAFAYFLFIMLLHALIGALIFYLLASWVRPGIACVCSLFFAFHPTLEYWLGKIDTHQHQLTLLLLILSLAALKKHIFSHNSRFLVLSSFLFFLCIMTRETPIIIPLVLILGLLTKQFPITPPQKNRFWSAIVWMGTIVVFYTILRLWAYPFNIALLHNSYISSQQTFFSFIKTQAITAGSFLYNIFWMLWFPWSTYLYFKAYNALGIYALVRCLILGFVTFLFITNSKKSMLIFLTSCGLLLLWPLVITPYGGHRFLYDALVPFAIFLAFLINFSKFGKSTLFRSITIAILILLININASFVFQKMREQHYYRQQTQTAIHALKHKPIDALAKSSIVLINSTDPFFSGLGVTQELELDKTIGKYPHFFIKEITLHAQSKTPEKYMTIVGHQTELRLVSHNTDKVWFTATNATLKGFHFLEKVIINKYDQRQKISDVSIFFKNSFLQPNIPFVVLIWSEQQRLFIPMEV